MKDKTKGIIIYHSGAGSTKTIAEIYNEKLILYLLDVLEISRKYDYNKLKKYDFFIFAFPTYHCEPSASMQEFIEEMPTFKEEKRAFIFTTCGLYSGNTLRIFAKKCLNKNIIVCGSSVYRSPATDGALLLPKLNFMFNFEKNIVKKLRMDISKIQFLIDNDIKSLDFPRFRLHAIFNYPNKILGKNYKHKIHLNKEKCINCGECIENCIRDCWKEEKEYPKYELKNCEFCFKCVHHCPKEAIILSRNTRKKVKLNKSFYKKQKEKILSELELGEG